MRQTIRLAMALWIVFAADARAQEEKPHPNAARINQMLDFADRARARGLSWEDYQHLGDVLVADLPLAQQAAREEAEAWERVAEAYRRQDKEAIEALTAEARRLEEVSQLWLSRRSARQTQNTHAATELRTLALIKSDGLAPAGRAAIEARRAAFEAWGDYAESISPEVPEEDRHRLHDRARVAEVESEIAQWRWNWSNELWEFQRDPTVGSAALTARIKEIEQVHEALIEARRQLLAAELRSREASRQRQAALSEVRQAHQAAVKAKQEAEQRARDEAARKAKEEAERKQKEEAERKAKEEADRKAKEEAAKKAGT